MKQTQQLTNILTDKNLMKVVEHMQTYLVRGSINFSGLMTVPSKDRIPALAKEDFPACLKVVNNAIHLFLSASGVNANTSVMISSSILNEAHEDNLSVEDVVMFLMKLSGGQYGKFFGAITPDSFMEKFEEYRQERHEVIMNIRYEDSAQHKALGPSERESDNNVDERKLMAGDVLKYHYDKHIKSK